ncbi:MAG TPA: hypothetical protein VGK67_15870 [Myxococcales bacterium]|jgi:acyl-CoA dehydrogenase
MLLLNPQRFQSLCPDAPSRELVHKTIAFFEQKGLDRIKKDDHERTWYADFLEFQKKEKLFATFLTPATARRAGTRCATAS